MLSHGSFVVVATPSSSKGKKQADSLPGVTAIGTGVQRKGICVRAPTHGAAADAGQQGRGLVLRVGVRFTPESMISVTKLFEGLSHKKAGAPMAGVLFNSSVGIFDFEPVLKALKTMDGVPLGDTLVDMDLAGPPTLAHGGARVSQLPGAIRGDVESDPSQMAALQLMLDSKVALVQGPPGTGKSYSEWG